MLSSKLLSWNEFGDGVRVESCRLVMASWSIVLRRVKQIVQCVNLVGIIAVIRLVEDFCAFSIP